MKTRITWYGCDDKKHTEIVTDHLAISIARVIASKPAAYDVVIHGEYGECSVFGDGYLVVTWNDRSTTPGKITEYNDRTEVCL